MTSCCWASSVRARASFTNHACMMQSNKMNGLFDPILLFNSLFECSTHSSNPTTYSTHSKSTPRISSISSSWQLLSSESPCTSADSRPETAGVVQHRASSPPPAESPEVGVMVAVVEGFDALHALPAVDGWEGGGGLRLGFAGER